MTDVVAVVFDTERLVVWSFILVETDAVDGTFVGGSPLPMADETDWTADGRRIIGYVPVGVRGMDKLVLMRSWQLMLNYISKLLYVFRAFN